MAKKSITETGPKALRGVRNPDLYPTQSLGLSDIEAQSIRDELARSTYANYEAAHGHLGYQGLNDPSLYAPIIDTSLPGYGDSMYDKGILVDATPADVQDQRAANQPVWAKAGAGVLKGTGLAASTFISGTAGFVDGVVESIIDGDLSRMWDNTVTQSVDAFNRGMESVLPNYYSQDELQNPFALRNIFSANTIFDKFVKNIGFTVGAAYSGGIYSKMIGGIAKGLGYAKGASKIFKLGDIAKDRMKEMTTIQKLNTLGKLGVKAVEQSSKVKASKALAGSIMNAYAEGTIEAESNTNDAIRVQAAELDNRVQQDKETALSEIQERVYNGEITPEEANTLLAQKYAEIDNAAALSKKKMEENRTKIGDGILIANLPILTLDNFLMFGKMYAGGWKAARNQVNTVTRVKKEAMREAKEAAKRGDRTLLENLKRVKNTPFGKLSDADRAFLEEVPKQGLMDSNIATLIKSPIREGNEEMMQAWASETYMDLYKRDADYVYDSKMNPDAAEQFGDFWSEFWKSHIRGFENSYGNPQRWEEFMIGALTGAMGAPTFGRTNNSTEQTWLGRGKVVGLTGGIAADLKDLRASRQERLEVAQHIDRIMHDPNLKNRLEHVRAQIALNNDKQAAVELKDKKMYKDAETAALFEDIMYLKRANKLDLLDGIIDSMENVSDEDAQAIIDATTEYMSATQPDVDTHRQEIDRLDHTASDIWERMQELGGQISEALEAGDEVSAHTLGDRVAALNQQLEEVKEARDSHQQALDSIPKRRVSPYVKPDGTVFTPDEVRQAFAEKTKKMKDFVKMVSDVQDEIDLSTSEILSDNQLATLTYYQVATKDWINRGANIITDLKDTLVNSNMVDILRKHIHRHREQLELETQAHGGFSHEEAQARIEQTLKNLDTLDSNLGQFLETNPEALISMLANVENISTTDEEGNVSTTNLKEIFLQTLNNAIETDPLLSDNEKAEAKTNVEDLGKMIDSLREKNQIFKDALANPGNIERRQAAIDSKHLNRKQKKLINKFKEEVDFEDTLSVKAAYNKYKSGINEMGLDKFLKNFTKAEQEVIRGAIGNASAKQIISGIIDDDINEGASVKSAAKQVLDGIEDLSPEGLHKLSTDSAVDEAIVKAASELVESINDDDVVRSAKQAELEGRIKELLEKAASKASEAIEEKVKDLAGKKEVEDSSGTYGSDKNTSPTEKASKADNEGTSDPHPNPGYASVDSTAGPSPAAGTEGPSPGTVETSTDREDEYDANENKSESKVKTVRQKAVGLSKQDPKNSNNLAFRRQLTEFYIFGEYGQKLADWYEQDKGRVPDPLDADSFIAYLRAVTDFLNKNGAFTYVSGVNKDNKLTNGQEIWFDVEESLTDANGVKVVVIKTLDSQNNEQVIGTIRTQYEFEAYDAAVEDGRQERSKSIEAQKELYEEVIRRHENGITDKVTTKVDKLTKGSLPLVRLNSTVAEVFDVNDSTEDSAVPIIGVAAPRTANSPTIIIHNGNRADNVAEVDSAVLLPGQVYVLIPSNTGQYVPALCTSTPISELSSDDWYIQQAANALWDVFEKGVSRKSEFVKWLPVKNFHINLRRKNEQGKWEDAALGSADAAFIKFTGKDGKEVNRTVSLKDAEGNPLSKEVIMADLTKFIMDTGKYQKLYTNVDKKKLSDLNYVRNISKYLQVNLPRGLGGQHTMNDGFLYTPTSIERQHTGDTAAPRTPVETQTTPQGTSKLVIYKGKKYTVDMAGQVLDSKGVPIRGKLAEEIKKTIEGTPTAPTAGTKKASTRKPTTDPFDTRGRRKRKPVEIKPSAKSGRTYWEAFKEIGLNEGDFAGAIENNPWNKTAGVTSTLSHLQAEVIRKQARKVFEDAANSDNQRLHDAIVSNARSTSATTNVLHYLYKALNAVKEGKMSVDEAMALLEYHLIVEDDTHKELLANLFGKEAPQAAKEETITQDLKTVFGEIQAQKGSDVPVLAALGFLDRQFSYEGYVAAMQLADKIKQRERTSPAPSILTREQYERLGKALSQTDTDETEVLRGRDIFAAYKNDVAEYEKAHIQDLSEYLKARNINIEDYKKLSLEDKISILHCI